MTLQSLELGILYFIIRSTPKRNEKYEKKKLYIYIDSCTFYINLYMGDYKYCEWL